LDGAAIAMHEAEAGNARAEAETFEVRSLVAERRRREAHWTALAAILMLKQERAARLAAGLDAPVPPSARPTKELGQQDATPVSSAPAEKLGLPFLAHRRGYLASRMKATDDFPALKPNSIKQAGKTFDLWSELMGDLPVGATTKVESRRFRSLVRTLPATYGKAGRGVPVKRRVEIERARARQAAVDARNAARPPAEEREPDVPIVSLKTVKRHFSALSAYWQWLEVHGHAAEDSNPFVGFGWPGVRKGRKGRDAWSEDDLRTLLTSPRFASYAEHGTFWWLAVIGMYSGMRLEEIARLRSHLDIRELHGRLAFVIQEHPDWNPKTEAGARIVPVHPLLLNRGFKNFIKRRASEGYSRLFFDLPARGDEGNYGPDFSREFSRYKQKLGIGRSTVFHSFRHSVRTILTNAPADLFRDPWIDAVMGHAADEEPESGRPKRQSVGVTTYLKAVEMMNLCKVVDAIRYPVEPR
jgi:integrase